MKLREVKWFAQSHTGNEWGRPEHSSPLLSSTPQGYLPMSGGGEFCFPLSQAFQLNLLLSAGCLGLLQQTLQLSHSLLQLCALQLRILKLKDRIPCLGQQAKEDSVWVSQKICSSVVIWVWTWLHWDLPFRKPQGNCMQQRLRKPPCLATPFLPQVCPDIAATCWLCFWWSSKVGRSAR